MLRHEIKQEVSRQMTQQLTSTTTATFSFNLFDQVITDLKEKAVEQLKEEGGKDFLKLKEKVIRQFMEEIECVREYAEKLFANFIEGCVIDIDTFYIESSNSIVINAPLSSTRVALGGTSETKIASEQKYLDPMSSPKDRMRDKVTDKFISILVAEISDKQFKVNKPKMLGL